ncbi:carboxylesterase family protein [Amycolatopsis sp. PS_44_ISF1]|uniref:carboxylesterase/lipase family protein n=1 Tax=Amycolatopsis sp. PS_44_ISF1 TaxID=2974917 RepID=UPI0028DD74D4|nr:carboxylesterase family protein [Amycolatopsis sp. PS_44_ISF1]MDT8912294.1 carboxylesterase family protein [Amycolatopsis sp. PS_44_ISF1]
MNRATAVLATVLAVLVPVVSTGCSSGDGPAPDASLTVPTSSGTLHGLSTPSAREFLGIPYALPPTGPRRWTLPQPQPAAAGVVEATKAGPPCAQTPTVPGASRSDAEDCLFANVTTPRDAEPGAKLPVMVWWHGGGYTTGSGAQYDAQRLASRGHVVVVSINYRLGVFGYFGLPGLAGSGDFGFADQIAGTRWAKRNAAAFGGDPDNVTVFGESAGGMSACALLTSPQAKGLVQKVAISSGSCLLKWPAGGLYPGLPSTTPYTSVAVTGQDGVAAAKTLGCAQPDPLPCLRALPAPVVMKVNQTFANHLSYDTDLLPADPAQAVRQGRLADVPVLSGGNRDEHNAFVAGVVAAVPEAVTAASYPALLKTAFGLDADQVHQRYPLDQFASSGPAAWAKVVSDSAWACPTLAGEHAMAAKTKVYGYEFADPDPPNLNGTKDPRLMGAAHATDLPYLFDLAGRNLLTRPGQAELGDTMIGYWSSFARTGVPTAPGAPAMAAMTPTSATVTTLAPGAVHGEDTSAIHRCDLWREVSTP